MRYGDLEGLLPLLKRCWEELGVERSGESWSDRTVWLELVNAMSYQSRLMVLVAEGRVTTEDTEDAESEGRLLGCGVVGLVPSVTDGDHVKAVEAVWHSDPRLPVATRGRVMVKLLAAMEEEAMRMGARTLHVAARDGSPALRHLLKHGFEAREWTTVKRLR
jgi:hypothetical protein